MPLQPQPLLPGNRSSSSHGPLPVSGPLHPTGPAKAHPGHHGASRVAPHVPPRDNKVFTLGTLGLEIATKSREASLGQLDRRDGCVDSVDDLARLLAKNPHAASSLRWTLDIAGHPIYVIEPQGPHAAEVFRRLIRLLQEQLKGDVERVSLAGHLTGRHVAIHSGQQIPVVRPVFRGLFGWTTEQLVDDLVAGRSRDGQADALRTKMHNALDSLYRDHQHRGDEESQRALHCMMANPSLLGRAVAEAASQGLELSGLHVDPTPDGAHPRSDGRRIVGVELIFFGPDLQSLRRPLYVDVADEVPIMLAERPGEDEPVEPLTYHFDGLGTRPSAAAEGDDWDQDGGAQ